MNFFKYQITIRTKAYKAFKFQYENTPSERFWMDGERELSKKELKFLEAYEKQTLKRI